MDMIDRELAKLPSELRWRECMRRIEAVLFASATPVPRADLARVVGRRRRWSCCSTIIYGIALEGLGEDTKFGSAGLVMAILGGALLPLVQGAVIDVAGATFSYVVPAAAFLIVLGYGLFDFAAVRGGAARTA